MYLKLTEKEHNVSKINKKYNVLKEKVTLLFDLEEKIDTLEKKVEEKISHPVPQSTENEKEGNKEIKCNLCDFVAKNKFGLKIHFHKKHSTAKFRCFTCDFTCESHGDLVDHNEKYYYSHRQNLNKDHEKDILDEFQQLDQDGFIPHRKLDW